MVLCQVMNTFKPLHACNYMWKRYSLSFQNMCCRSPREKTKLKVFLRVKNISVYANSWFQQPLLSHSCGQEKEGSFLPPRKNCPPNVTLRQGEESEEEISVSSLFVILFHSKAVSSQWKQLCSCWLPSLCIRQREMTACCKGRALFTRNHWNSLILALNKQARKQQQETVRCVGNGGEQPRNNWCESLQLKSACGPCNQPAWLSVAAVRYLHLGWSKRSAKKHERIIRLCLLTTQCFIFKVLRMINQYIQQEQ